MRTAKQGLFNGRMSVRMSVPSIDRCKRVRRVRCWAPRGQEISIDKDAAAARRSAANASSVELFTALTAAVEGLAETCCFSKCDFSVVQQQQ